MKSAGLGRIKPKIFVLIGVALLFIAIIFSLCETKNVNFPSEDLRWMSRVQWVCIDLMRVSFFIAVVLKSLKVIKNKFILIGIIMFSFYVIYFFYAINHPELDFPLSSKVIQAIYATYLGVTVTLLVTGGVIELIKYIKNKRRIVKKD